MVLISPDGDLTQLAYKLQFKNTNNIAEYEVLQLDIIAANQRGVKILGAQGDAELIMKQVRGQYIVKNTRLRDYRNRVWDEIEDLDAFSIQIVPRE